MANGSGSRRLRLVRPIAVLLAVFCVCAAATTYPDEEDQALQPRFLPPTPAERVPSVYGTDEEMDATNIPAPQRGTREYDLYTQLKTRFAGQKFSFDDIAKGVSKVVDTVKTVASKVATTVKTVASKVASGVQTAVSAVKNVVQKVTNAVSSVISGPAQNLLGALGVTPKKPLQPRPAPEPGRKLPPDFDLLDRPEKCPERCNGRGKCLIDKSRLKVSGLLQVYPYKCVCHPEWTGVSCQTRVDQYVRWFESNGTLPFPKCCNVCPSQWTVPRDYDSLPVYRNPYSVANCDPQLSVDSRPEPGGKPPCWRPLSAQPFEPEPPSEESSEGGEVSFVELQDGPVTITPAQMAAANELERQRLEERLKYPISECCIYCDFDFWAEVNSRPPSATHSPRGMDLVHMLERQRVSELFGGEAVMREMKRREQLRAAEAEESAFLETNARGGPSSAQQIQIDTLRAERREARDAERRGRTENYEARTDPLSGSGTGACCSVCPVAARDPDNVNMDEYNKEHGVDEDDNRFGSFLRRGRGQAARSCCGACPSQFWLHTVAQDTDPFYGPEKMTPPKVIPSEESSEEASQQSQQQGSQTK